MRENYFRAGVPAPYFEDDTAILFCEKMEEILPYMTKKAEILLTDPPYGIPASAWERTSFGNNGRAKLWGNAVTWDRAEQGFFDVPRTYADEAIIWGGNNYISPPSARWLIWDKKQTTTRSECELAWTTMTGGNKIFRMSRIDAYFNKRLFPKEHPNEKPIQLLVWCLHFFGKKGVTILDPFAGVGTTMIAAALCGHKSIGIEISEKYCEIAVKRIQQIERGEIK